MLDKDFNKMYPAEKWTDDDSFVLWHHLENGYLCEPPIVEMGGDRIEGEEPWPGYYSHWSYLPSMKGSGFIREEVCGLGDKPAEGFEFFQSRQGP